MRQRVYSCFCVVIGGDGAAVFSNEFINIISEPKKIVRTTIINRQLPIIVRELNKYFLINERISRKVQSIKIEKIE